MLKVIDIWEGDVTMDASVLLDAGISGAIVRLNDMSGGHHKDELFDAHWVWAKQFAVQSLYFVYNPWVDGKTNAAWLFAHLPADFARRRIFVDIEVKYAGYSPETYADEVDAFMTLVRNKYPASIYTGGWFLSILAHWPKGSYWWGRYPAVFWPQRWDDIKKEYVATTEAISWAEWDRRAKLYGWNPDPDRLCPGTIDLHQISADHIILPGTSGRAVDVNLFPFDNVELLKQFFGMPDSTPIPPTEEPMANPNDTRARLAMVWETHDQLDLAAMKGKVDGLIIYAGGNNPKAGAWLNNPNVTKQIQWAADLDIACLLLWEWDQEDYYGMGGVASKWPEAARDENLIELDKSYFMTNEAAGTKTPRRVHGFIYNCNKIKNRDGSEPPDFWVGGWYKDRLAVAEAHYGKKPWWALIFPETPAKFASNPNSVTVNWVTGLNEIACKNLVQTEMGSRGTLIPVAGSKPMQPYAKVGGMWWYGQQTFPGIKDKNGLASPVVLYQSNLDPKAFREMMALSTGVVIPPPNTDPTPPGNDPGTPPVDVTGLGGKLDRVIALLEGGISLTFNKK